MRDYLGERNYAIIHTLGAADTPDIVNTPSPSFASELHFLLITYVDLACYIAKDATNIAAAAGGAQDDRIYLPASAQNLLLPWSGADLYILNAAATETPTIHAVGII